MLLRWLVLAFFVVFYGFLCLSRRHRAAGVWISIALMVLARYLLGGQDPQGDLSVGAVLTRGMNWNVLGVLAGAMVIAGLFVMAYALNRFGWVREIAHGVAGLVGKDPFVSFTVIVWLSVLISAFVDNIPYVALMLPVTRELAATDWGHPFLYAAGLVIGACIGGNITPIGASCNVVAVGLLRREGHNVSFWQFARIGLPFTLVATAAGYVFLWAFWR